MDTEIQHGYTEAHATLYTKDKDQTATPMRKKRTGKNHYNNTVSYIMRHT